MVVPLTDTLAKEPQAHYGLALPADASILERIHQLRGVRVMLDRDLARLYAVETKHLKRQVKRNLQRFPEDFMFELTSEEHELLRSQFGTLRHGEHSKYLPFAFTEHGILMLSSVLSSERAILVNIHIIRVFNRLREALSAQQGIVAQLEQIAARVDSHDVDIAAILRVVRHLQEQPAAPRKPIGF
jgi:phage regulator Rha-like protein